jgi:hypothetical protein
LGKEGRKSFAGKNGNGRMGQGEALRVFKDIYTGPCRISKAELMSAPVFGELIAPCSRRRGLPVSP